jgi:hypothetical protein
MWSPLLAEAGARVHPSGPPSTTAAPETANRGEDDSLTSQGSCRKRNGQRFFAAFARWPREYDYADRGRGTMCVSIAARDRLDRFAHALWLQHNLPRPGGER